MFAAVVSFYESTKPSAMRVKQRGIPQRSPRVSQAMTLFFSPWMLRWTERGGVEIVIVFCIQKRGFLQQN
jgi:hypothetical protein